MASASFPRAVAMSALQAGFTGAWIAARELSPARRRLTRAGMVAVAAAASYAVDRARQSRPDELEVAVRPFPVTDPEPAAPPKLDNRKIAVAAALLGVSTAAHFGRRRLEKHWLARLTGAGHQHPTRVLAVRMAAVEFAVQVAVQAAGAAQRRASRRAPEAS